MKLFVFTSPDDAKVNVRHDTGKWNILAVPGVHPSGRKGQVIDIPENTPNGNGCQYDIIADGMVQISGRAILMFGSDDLAYLLCDDFHLQKEKECPEAPPIPPIPPPTTDAKNPLELIQQIGKTADLTTKEGCGKFTEECCKQLHEKFSASYGHLKKTGAQNQYNGHAVDAINLLMDHANPDGSTTPSGVYDIITSSESPEAKPAFNFAGPANPLLWYFPA